MKRPHILLTKPIFVTKVIPMNAGMENADNRGKSTVNKQDTE